MKRNEGDCVQEIPLYLVSYAGGGLTSGTTSEIDCTYKL